MPRFRPAFCRTFRPGSGAVPFAERVMPAMFRFSTRTMSNRRARSVVAFRPSPCDGRPPGFQPCDGQLDPGAAGEPRRARPACAGGGGPLRSGPVKRGTRSISPVDSAPLTVTPRSMPATWPFPGRGPDRGSQRRRHASVRTVECHPVGLHALVAPDGTSGIAPTRPSVPAPHPRGATAARPIAARAPRRSGIPRPGRPCARSAAGPGCAGRGTRPRLGEVPQCLLLDHLAPRGQPCMLGPGPGELAALHEVTRRAFRGQGASAIVAPPPGSRCTGRGRSSPAAPLPGRAWAAAGTWTYEHTSE